MASGRLPPEPLAGALDKAGGAWLAHPEGVAALVPLPRHYLERDHLPGLPLSCSMADTLVVSAHAALPVPNVRSSASVHHDGVKCYICTQPTDMLHCAWHDDAWIDEIHEKC